MSKLSMLSTIDNPYDPFTQYDEWFAYDEQHEHHSPSLLARVVGMSNELSDADQSFAIELAIDEIVKHNVSGVHIKVSKEIKRSDAT